MTATEDRAAALLRLAEWRREGTLPDADADLMLRAIFPNIDPTVYRLHWERVCDHISEEHAIRDGKWENDEPLRSMDLHSRSHVEDEMADEVRGVAREQAVCCVMVATRHAAAKYTTGSAA